jgi:hypothetical protein
MESVVSDQDPDSSIEHHERKQGHHEMKNPKFLENEKSKIESIKY